ncbi:MAG: ATP-dependent DNA helicase RecQ [Flavobacteriales bacterium]|nr:ATP-dependent DNA helicase RecQ [Flavobacteriales bacterium]
MQELIHDTLKNFFGFKNFKGNQEKAINSIVSGKDTFVIMPTGGGKSLCYQLPALILDGVAIIISPLIALMKNQVDSMRSYSKNENIAHFYNSTLNESQKKNVKQNVLNGTTKLLFIAPETMNKDSNINFLKKCNISFFAIDEAHCISEWGHDFRPEYRKLKSLIEQVGRQPIIALTATATQKVQNDIAKNLSIENSKILISSFNRSNLFYEVRTNTNAEKEIIKFIRGQGNKSGIIYCLSRKKAEEIAELLNINQIKSAPYHAGLEKSVRMKTQDDFLLENIDVVVATIAFGMGIDKPDVRYVIHYNLPKSLENYYQETGRAGRDGGEGNCILFHDPKDVEKFQKFNNKKNPKEKEISKQLLDEMVNFIVSKNCRRAELLKYFGEDFIIKDCLQKCDNCKSKNYEKTNEVNLNKFDPKLFNLLKKIRKEISEAIKVPPFIIFQDTSLEDMAINYPISNEELENIIGVGRGKAEKYGQKFIEFIKSYVEENKIEKVLDCTIKSKAKKNDLKIFIIQSTDLRISFEDIMLQKKIDMDQLISEFENIVQSGTKLNINYHINDILDDQQQDEIYHYFIYEATNDSIKEAMEYFDFDYNEEEMRLMRIKVFSDLAN